MAAGHLIPEGFQDAKALSRKLVALFSFGRQLLSKQQHYDRGLRALKMVLGMVGQLLHQAKGKGEGQLAPCLVLILVAWPKLNMLLVGE